jgi:hypothetical protein
MPTIRANPPNAWKIIVAGASLTFGSRIHNSSDYTNSPKPGCSSTPAYDCPVTIHLRIFSKPPTNVPYSPA